jgi:hypothetical protein
MPTAAAAAPGPLTPVRSGTRRVVLLSLALQIPQTVPDRAAIKLRTQWPEVRYVYLTPVAERRTRGAERRSIPRTPR